MDKWRELIIKDLAYKVKVYAQKQGITTDQALEELRDLLEEK